MCFYVCCYVPYGALPCIPLHSVTAHTGNNEHPVPLLVCYTEGLLVRNIMLENLK